MEQIILQTNFSKIGFQNQLRLDARYRFFKDEKNNTTELLKKAKTKGIPLGSVLELANTVIVKKGELDKEMILVDLENIEPGFGLLKEENIVTEIGSDKTAFNDAEIVYSKLTPEKGHCFLNDKTKTIIGTTELIGYRVKIKNWDKKFLMYLLIHKSFRDDLAFLTSGKTHPRIHIPDFLAMKIPFISYERQKEVIKKIEKIEVEILLIKKKIESLQNIIDDILVKYKVKSGSYTDGQWEYFSINSQKIGDNLFLRLGAQYYAFFEVHQGLLFDKYGVFEQVPLGRLIKKYKTQVLKKGALDKPYTLLDLEQLEAKTGRILDETNEVEEIGSDKVLFGGADIIISKLRPYLSYVLINDKSKNFIGTTELVPFKLISNDVNLDYLKYCLLSNEYIKKSELLMYGKEHPRIDIKDLLSIKIPLPSLKIQSEIVSEIQQREAKSNQYKEQVKKLREEIDNLIYESLRNG